MSINTSIWEPLKVPTFRLIWMSVIVSNLGTMIQTVGAGWLMASISGSDLMVALVQASNTMPMMVLSLVSGALADSFDRRGIVLTAQSFMFAVAVTLTILTATGAMTPWLLLSLTFLIGCGVAFHMPAWQASLGDIVPRDQISKAVNLNSMGFNLTRSIGPALGGVVVAVVGTAAAFAINAFSYIPMILSVRRWKPTPRDTTLPRESLGLAIRAGLRYVAMSPNQLIIMARGFLFTLCSISVLALMPLIARDVLSGTSITFGLLLGAYGTGAIIGGLFSTRLRVRYGNEAIARGAVITFALSAGLISFSQLTWVTTLALLPAGGSWLLILSMLNASIQLMTPKWVMGRSLSLYQTANFGGMAAGSALWGAVANLSSPQSAVLIAAGALSLNLLFGLRFPLDQFGAADLDPLGTFIEPQLATTLSPQSGPIAITVEYEIDAKDVQTFLTLMSDRRRIRIRDGARHWSLSRDLEQSHHWIERYTVPTWVEYVRHHKRRTKTDAENGKLLRAINRHGAAPKVRRMIERHNFSLKSGPGVGETADPFCSQY